MPNMLAAVLHDFDDLRLEQVPRPRAEGHGEVVVQIAACGFCATDYKAIRGLRRNVEFPLICGHEPSGIVAEVGPGVTQFKVGDAVIVSPSGFCGLCRNCRLGRTHYCEHAWTTGGDGPTDVRPGAFAEYMKTEQCSLYHKPPNVTFAAAALTEPLSGAWKGVIRASELRVGEDVVVIGVGGIGLLCAMVARAAGAARVVAIDPSPFARRHALACGATHGVDPVVADPYEQVYDIMPDGPDLVIEAAGPIQAVELMVRLRRRGTRWNVFGITTHETFELDGGLTHFLEGRMDASFGTNPEAMINAIGLMEHRLVDPEKIITHRFPLEEMEEALEAMAGGDRNKVLICPHDCD